MHGDWSGEVDEAAGATETSSGSPRERDVGVLAIKTPLNSEKRKAELCLQTQLPDRSRTCW